MRGQPEPKLSMMKGYLMRIETYLTSLISEEQQRYRLKALIYTILVSIFYTTIKLLHDNSLSVFQYGTIITAQATKLILIKMAKSRLVTIIYLIEYCVLILSTISNDNFILRLNTASLLMPFAIQTFFVHSNYSYLILIANVSLIVFGKFKLTSFVTYSDKSTVMMLMEDFYSTLLLLGCFSWVLSLINKTQFDKCIADQDYLRSELNKASKKSEETAKLLKTAEEELKAMKVVLEQAVAVKDHILASVSHELRNPLNSLMGHVDMVYEEIRDDKLKALLDMSKICGDILSNEINNLLDASKFTTDKLYLSTESSDIFLFMERVWKMSSIKMKQKNLRAELYISKNISRYLMIDTARVLQVFSNCIDNAIKFTDTGNIRIFISWHNKNAAISSDLSSANVIFSQKIDKSIDTRLIEETPTQIEWNKKESTSCKTPSFPQSSLAEGIDEFAFARPPLFHHSMQINQRTNSSNCLENNSFNNVIGRDYHLFTVDQVEIIQRLQSHGSFIEDRDQTKLSGSLRFEVIDTGCGISSSFQKHLFEPFAKEDIKVNRKYGGSGLGLFIIKKIVDQMEGVIKIYSQKRLGTDCVVVIPAEISKKSINRSTPKHLSILGPGTNNNNRKCVLVVDDNPYNVKVMTGYMEKLEFEVSTCTDGVKASIIYLEKGAKYFTFISLDIQMPVMDGITCAKLIRKYEKQNFWPETPIVFVSGNSDQTEKKLCLDPEGEIRASFFYQKPLPFSQCQSFVNTILLSQEKMLNVLIVDDDPFNILMMGNYFQKEKVHYEVITNCMDSINRVRFGPANIDVILMDCKMLKTDFVEATLEIKKILHSGNKKDIAVIGLSENLERTRVEECLKAGIIRMFQKPVNLTSLINYMRDIVV